MSEKSFWYGRAAERLSAAAPDLIEALRPFAAIALLLDEDDRPGALDMIDVPCLAITPAQVRAARLAIAKVEGIQYKNKPKYGCNT